MITVNCGHDVHCVAMRLNIHNGNIHELVVQKFLLKVRFVFRLKSIYLHHQFVLFSDFIYSFQTHFALDASVSSTVEADCGGVTIILQFFYEVMVSPVQLPLTSWPVVCMIPAHVEHTGRQYQYTISRCAKNSNILGYRH